MATNRFQVIWNAPSQRCTGCHGINITSRALESYSIDANPTNSFNGSVVTIFYASGLWPSLDAKLNATPCWTGKKPCSWNPWGMIVAKQNGGVPQAADLNAHVASVKAAVATSIPDPGFAGVAIMDWEAWRPLSDENYDALSCYTEYSRRLTRQLHPDWNSTRVAAAASDAFDSSARAFFEATVRAIHEVRPWARVGYYSEGINNSPSAHGKALDDRLAWLWGIVDVLAPSVYPRGTNATAEASRVASLVGEAIRSAELGGRWRAERGLVARKAHVRPAVMPYARAFVQGDPPAAIPPQLMASSIAVTAALGAEGLVLWGSSADYRGCGRCQLVHDTLHASAGPLVRGCVANRDACAKARCSGHGRCVDDVDEAESTACSGSGVVINQGACRCDVGYEGDHCEVDI